MRDLVLKESEFQKFSRYVYETSGINLHGGKKELLKARLGKILRQKNLGSFREYYDQVVSDESGHELTVLLNSISTNLTFFFREQQHFDFLRATALPEFMDRNGSSKNNCVRLWSAGCSSGEEPYSIAMTMGESFDHKGSWGFKILATDISTKVLTTASTGVYSKESLKKTPYDLKRKYFQKGTNKWEGYFRVKNEVKKNIDFRRLNFMESFHFSDPFDVIFCRNVMIYFDNPTRETLVEKFSRALAVGGYLFIGHAESLTGIKYNLQYIQPSIYKKV